jgi:hypothetical protein
MKSNDVIMVVAVFLLIGFSICMKYLKKNKTGTDVRNHGSDTSFSSVKEDYEPYSRK